MMDLAIHALAGSDPSVVIFSAPRTFPWTLVTAFVALFGIGLAFFSSRAALRSAREIARKRATLDMIEKVESTAHYRELISTFSYYRRQKSFDKLTAPTEEREKSDRQKVLDYLNHYELVAIGIKAGSLDRDIYACWMEPVYVRDWNAAADFIQRERWKSVSGPAAKGPNIRKNAAGASFRYHGDIYSEFQDLANYWSTEARRLSINDGGMPSDGTGPGDDPLPARDEPTRS
ncbi:MAG: hypothetical protein Tsb008_04230 [Rhodothalassiaceae bacterium]